MKDILRQPKFKGDVHVDKPISEFKQRGSEKIGGPFGGFVGVPEPVQPFGQVGFAKHHHGHGKVPNQIKYRG